MYSTKTNETITYNASSYINSNDYLPPKGCIPSAPTSTTSSGTSVGKREVRELAAGFSNTYTIQINGADPTALQQLYASVESGALPGSSSVASLWADLNGISSSSVTHLPFQGGVDSMGNVFSAVSQGSIGAAKQGPLVPGAGGTGTTTTTSSSSTSTTPSSSNPTCDGGCIAGAVVGSVVLAALLADFVYMHYKGTASAASALTATSAAKPEPASVVTVRTAVSV